MTEAQFETKRLSMVTDKLVHRGITDERVVKAFVTVPRHLFVPAEGRNLAYEDHPLPIGHGQTISQPYMVAEMTQLLNLHGTERVLEIGTGSGYQTAVLAELAKSVYTIERIEILGQHSAKLRKDLGYRNIHFKIDDGTLGWPEEAPFDRIIVTAGAPKMPQALADQVAEGGMMVIPIGGELWQDLTVGRKIKGRFVTEKHGSCVFVKLIGEKGWGP
jgi:protein-L-isoaspartate(D-aspartate) O-methyltransferase